MLETSARLLRLLSLLQTPREWPGPELAERLGVTTRTVRNDVERLRALGYGVESRTGATGGYRLGAGAALPPLLLDDDEAVAVAVGLRAAAAGSVTGIEETSQRALRKLELSMPSRLRHRVDALRSTTVSAAVRGPTVDADVLTAVSTAAGRHERLRFDYVARDGSTTVRDVEPYRLVFTGRRWYLLAWDVTRADWRTFRADRLSPRTPTGPRFTPRDLPDEDVAQLVLRGVGSRAWPHPARVLLHAPVEAVAERIAPVGGVLTRVDEHTTLLETGGSRLSELAGYLGSLEVDLEILSPPTLREAMLAMAERLTTAATTPHHEG